LFSIFNVAVQTMELLLETIKSLSLANDMQTITAIVKKAVRKINNADGATFVLKENDYCHYVDEDAISPLWKGKKFAMDNCISGWVMRNRMPAIIPDIYEDNRIPHDIYRETFIKSMAMVPVRSEDPLGAIGVYWSSGFTPNEEGLELLQSVADSTAIAIEKINVLQKYQNTIKELKDLHKEIFDSKALYQTTLYSIGDAVISTDLNGNVVLMNPTAEMLTEWTLDEAKGKPLKNVFHIINQQTREICKDPVKSVLSEGLVLELSNHTALVSKNGYEYIISYSCSPIKDFYNENTGTVLIFKDETEKHLKTEKIKSFSRIFENSINEIYIFDTHTLQFVYANNGAIKNMGYTLNELKELTPVDIKPEFNEKTFLEALRTLSEDKVTNLIFETTHKRKDNSLYPVEVHLQKSTFDDKDVYVAIILDITERKQNEAKIKESEEKYRLLFENNPQPMWIYDLETLEFLEVNYAAVKHYGYTREEFLKMTLKDIRPKEDISALLLDVANTSSILNNAGEWRHLKKNGEIIDVEITSHFVHFNNREARHVLIKDITKQKELIRDIILAKDKAEESDKLKTAFLKNISHEIRTPMNGILGFSELLLNPDLTSDQKETYINVVIHSGHRMLNTVNDLIEISKIETGIVSINTKEVDIYKSIKELILIFSLEASKKGLNLVFENEGIKDNVIITTDQNMLDSILTYLIKNAIKYTLEGEITIDYDIKGNEVQFRIKDTGIGIPADRQHAIFDRFVQSDIADKFARQGSGLGLSISKAYVEMLGGQISVESKEGEGSCFYFTLPLNNKN
jgi:PAS domain S-box-containing protein